MEYFISVLTKLNLISVSYANSIEDTPIDMSTQITNSPTGVGTFISSIVIFLLVLAVLGGLAIIFSKKNEKQSQLNKSIKVLDKIKLDHNSHLFVIEIHNKVHILGKTDSNMVNVAEFSSPEDIQVIKMDCTNKQEITFQSILAEQFDGTTGLKKIKNTSSKAIKINRKEM